jgi:hypothetical protein
LDPDKVLIDLVFFDGASNVQKAGRILEAYNPLITSLHGAEHVVSLFFQDISKFPQINAILKIHSLCYNLFSSGSHHAPYALAQKYSRLHNGGRNIGLIRAADTRMGGHFIALLRFLRLKNTLVSTVTSAEFINLKIAKAKGLARILQREKLWDQVFLLVRGVYPALKVLRLADRKSAAMDKLLYYVRKTDKAIEKSVPEMDKFMEDVELVGNRAEVTDQAMEYFLGSPQRTRQTDMEYLAQDDMAEEYDSDSDDSRSAEGDLVDNLEDSDDNDDAEAEEDIPEGLGSSILHA